mmetsp:Transcript_72761/g.162899  ORF Transcript_72761/g.162899 Transcript_72761/m.162899 type:complete len:205 (-) Transcript_72761:19-633(-)
MEFFTVVVWATVILIMFLAKLKAAQDVMIAIILSIIMVVANADTLFSSFRFYKVFIVFRWALLRDLATAVCLTLAWLLVHGAFPEARAPGVLLHLSALAPWVLCGVQSSPLVSCGLWAGGRNQMTKVQLMLHIAAQVAGSVLAFCAFGLYYSFRFPGEGPFRHFFGLESLAAAAVTFAMSVVHIRNVDKDAAERVRPKDPAKRY